jgi:hypothetical protein
MPDEGANLPLCACPACEGIKNQEAVPYEDRPPVGIKWAGKIGGFAVEQLLVVYYLCEQYHQRLARQFQQRQREQQQ